MANPKIGQEYHTTSNSAKATSVVPVAQDGDTVEVEAYIEGGTCTTEVSVSEFQERIANGKLVEGVDYAENVPDHQLRGQKA